MSDELNPYLLYPDHEMDRRPRYYDGEFLRSGDFIDAQRYVIDRHRRHLHGTVSAGVVAGLTITAAVDRVQVAPGAAVDDKGRQIVLVATEEKAIAAADRGKNLQLYIAYAEVTSDEAQGEQGTAGYTRFHEMPVLAYVGEADALPTSAVLLARLQVDAAGGVTANTSTRPRAGLVVPGATPLTLRSNDADPGRATLAAALAVTVPPGTAHTNERPALDVDGFGRFTRGLIVGQTSATGYQGITNDYNDLICNGQLAAGGGSGSAIYKLGVGYAPPWQGEGTLTAQRVAIGRQDVGTGYVAHVEGKASVSGGIDTAGDVSIARTLNVTGNATLSANLGVTLGASVGGNLGVGGTLSATGNATLGGTLGVAGNTTVGGTLQVTAATTLSNTLRVENTVTATGHIQAPSLAVTTSDVTVARDVSVTRNLSAGGTLSSGGRADIGGALGVSTSLTVGSNIEVRGNTLDLGAGQTARQVDAGKIRYGVHSGDALDIVGAGTLSTNRKVKLWAEGGTETAGLLKVGGTLTSTNKLTVESNGFLVTGNGMIKSGGLTVGQDSTTGYQGVVQDGNDLVVNGQLAAGGSGGSTLYSLSIGTAAQNGREGYLFVNGRAAIGGTTADHTLDVNGTARVTSNATVGGNLSATGNLAVTGLTTLSKKLTIMHGESEGLRFADNAYGGGGDWSGLRYWRPAASGEDTRLELGTGNDGHDILVLRQSEVDVITLRNGRVGVRTDSAQEALHVTGKIRVNDDYAVVSRGKVVRVLWALINSSAQIVHGQGITVSWSGGSNKWFDVSFANHFVNEPAVIAQQIGSGNNRDNALVFDITTSGCRVSTGDSSGDRDARAFSILAIGEID